MNRIVSVAIDGPGGAGKSTMAKGLAARYGLANVDTGAMYRTVGLAVRRAGISPGDGAAVAALLPQLKLAVTFGPDGAQHMLLDGEDVTGQLRTPEMSAYSSTVSALPAVRAYLLETQRALARSRGVVMDGRDIGTVVLPDAELKIFLTASAEERAMRRWKELQQKETPQPYEDVLREMNERDQRDTTRAASPLRAAEDAVLLDTSKLDEAQVLEVLCALYEEKRKA